MIKRIGITGGIGSGKSVVSRLLAVKGVPVYIADDEAKRIMAEDVAIREALIRMFGPEIYPNGCLDRKKLAETIFGNSVALSEVNALIHPAVKNDFRRWTVEQIEVGHKQVAIESAILIEAGFSSEVDEVWMVYAPLELRLKRAMKRDGVSEEAVLRRIASQMEDEKKRLLAQQVVLNDEKHSLLLQLDRLL